ncbi:MAG: (d)CMP kinase [Alphaproteobacteria bacterium]|nr:(d)CMP kinase [Alphaproteobacteria bacterium]
MKWYLQNLRCGLRTAFFFPAPQRFIGSWHALMAIAATFVLSQLAMEFAIDGTGGEIAYSCGKYLACLFSLTLIASYISGYAARQSDRILDIAVAFLNSYYFIFLAYAFLIISDPDSFYESGSAASYQELIPIWAFLVMFRIVSDICSPELKKLVVSGVIAAAALYLLNSHVYFSRIYYVEEPEPQRAASPLDKMTSEELFNMQAGLRAQGLKGLKKSKPGQTDIYALTLGAYGYQDVFMRDVKYVGERLKSRLGVTNIIPMLNNRATVQTTALADATNLKAYLKQIAAHYMQPKEDILLLFMTSHGGAKTGLSVNLEYRYSLMDITPQMLKKILDDSGIQNRIIVISACYSGTFIPVLKDAHTIIMTAAAKDRVSFGCSDQENLTYFTQAYFMNGLSETTDLAKDFDIAKEAVQARKIRRHQNPLQPANLHRQQDKRGSAQLQRRGPRPEITTTLFLLRNALFLFGKMRRCFLWRRRAFSYRMARMSEQNKKVIIAVDGPAASGKGTFAKALASRLGYAYLDTGSIYRAIAHEVLERGGDPSKVEDVQQVLDTIEYPLPEAILKNPDLRTPLVEDATPKIGAMPEAQAAVRAYQEAFVKNPPGNAGGAVLDGRDVGTSVFPNADVKFYVTATAEERARRRFLQQKDANPGLTQEMVLKDINLRDARDMNRKSSSLRAADDAHILDTTHDTAAEALEKGVAIVKARLAPPTEPRIKKTGGKKFRFGP